MNKLAIEIFGRDLPVRDLHAAVQRFVHETFDAEWTVDVGDRETAEDFEDWWETYGRGNVIESAMLGLKEVAELGWEAGYADAMSKKHDDT